MESSSSTVRYFSISHRKLVLMSIATFSIYFIYWFYKNWKLVKARENSNLSPIVNGIFLIFTAYPLFKRVMRDATEKGYAHKSNSGTLAATFIGLIVAGNLSSRGDNLLFTLLFVISALAAVPVIEIQRAINFINQKADPDYAPSDRFSPVDIIIVVLGISLNVLVLMGSSWSI